MNGTRKDVACSEDCDSLIHSLCELVNPSSTNQVRKNLRKLFSRGCERVAADNDLTFNVHWSHIIKLLDKDPDLYRITCVDLDHPGTGEIVGNLDDSGMSAIVHLYIVRENGNRFRPLHKKKFGRLD